MEKTAELTVVQKTIIDTLYEEDMPSNRYSSVSMSNTAYFSIKGWGQGIAKKIPVAVSGILY